MPRPISLRAATGEDAGFLMRVYAGTRMEELAATDWSAEQKAQFCLMQYAAQDSHYRQHYPTVEYSIIEIAGTAIGRLAVDRWPREIRIVDLAILPQFRRRGVGTQLLHDLQTEAAASGKNLTIHVERSNPALRLYQRLGFRLIEDKDLHLLMEWRPDAHLR